MKYINYTGNKIFVFGSNTSGFHGAGAASYAVENYGAIYGQAAGLQGNSYAIITKDLEKGMRSVPLSYINEQVKELFSFARRNPDKGIFVTAIGTGLGGFTIAEIAPMFYRPPANIELCKEFKNYYDENRRYT